MTDKPAEAQPGAAVAPAAPEAVPAPLGVAVSELPSLRRVLASKPIRRRVGPEIAPGQVVTLPAEIAAEEIRAGRASDPDSKARS